MQKRIGDGNDHRIKKMNHKLLIFNVVHCFLLLGLYTSIDTITPEKPLKDGDVLVSGSETFTMGFFSPPDSNNRYVGIWFNKISEKTVVWVANRDNPINGTSGVLSISDSRDLVISSGNYSFPISLANSSTSLTREYKARLRDSGNFELFFHSNDVSTVVVWQSFDYPTNHQLPGMKIGLNIRTGQKWSLRSWKSVGNPAVGEYSYGVDLRGLPQQGLYKGSTLFWRFYLRSEEQWTGKSELSPIFAANYKYVQDQNEVSWKYPLMNTSVPYTTYLDELGYLQTVTWVDGKWNSLYKLPRDQCSYFGRCGAFGYCDATVNLYESYDFECSCLPGYEPKVQQQWYNLRDTSSGCVKKRPTLSMCGNGEGFVVMERIEVPDTSSNANVEMNLDLEGCRVKCLKDCSCDGFAIGGIGECITWHGNMTDVRKFPSGRLQFHVRVDHIELAQHSKKSKSLLHRKGFVIVVTSVSGTLVLVFSCVCWLISNKRKGKLNSSCSGFAIRASTKQNVELPVFDMVALEEATNKFSARNVIGEGGFGTVYKGQLSSGKDIAVKRLSIDSRQGLNEFMNEVLFITKLQHRNLVRLLGCCVHGEERMLVYEYMPNGSLDSIIFGNENGSRLLTWRSRLDIILGIARGILYLHQDSRLKIIHRDLKASNVLLDNEMNPKISDFGLARVFGGDQLFEKTRNVVGTYGYMAPEYAIDGLFSMKSDMFSFGVMVLEIVIGQRNRMFHHTEHDLNLLGHAWKFWMEGRAAELLDPLVEGSVPVAEVTRCIHVGLLCVQKCPEDRPTMSSALWMLVTDTAVLPPPEQPGFYIERSSKGKHFSQDGETFSINHVSITSLAPR